MSEQTDSPRARAFQLGSVGRFVIGEGATRDELQASGRWIATDSPVDLAGYNGGGD